MAIDEHPVAQMSRHVDVFLTRQNGRGVLALLHKDGHELVANFRNDLCVVYSDKLVIFQHILVKNEAFLDIMLVRLKTAFSHLCFC